MTEITKFERAVVRTIIERELGTSSPFLDQIDSLRIVDRDATGVGFFTRFELADSSKRLAGPERLVLGEPIGARLPDLRYDVGFVLYVEDGRISLLEGHTYGEEWPKEVTDFEIVTYESKT